ncbi:MAG TPA: DUF1549 and DUF1553 domain-containing protein [Tepidisphaeraceae bacterium]|nr:DUF1549 and DUF1553 domain-containing protein [Tepidisphaeraceae bacterium]
MRRTIILSRPLLSCLVILILAVETVSFAAGEKKPVHWSYVRPQRSALPQVKDRSWCRNPIDYFVLARLEKEGLHPAPQADRTTLIRRLSLDLIGLPPTIAETDAFVNDPSSDAYERLVDRLLASPHFGERAALRWLDLARYADSNGYEKDRLRSMWPYRDWVIKAFNADMPFDEFTIKQIAGDLLPNATVEDKIATGFNRNTMLNEEGGVDPEEYRYYANVDRVNTTSTVWLGTTLACAQCHNHKYDPFTQKDYYQLLAYFNSTAAETSKEGGTDPHDISVKLPVDPPDLRQMQERLAQLTHEQDEPEHSDNHKQIEELKRQIAAYPKTTLIMQELPKPRPTHIHIRGGFLTEGDLVEPGTPAVLTQTVSAQSKSDRLQNRLDLARWLISDDNPLTARVQVNRIWEQLFGRGIVATSEDFGTQGDPPTHPLLLDWLACELMHPSTGARPWTEKAIYRLIVTSATYRQSSDVTPELEEKDPQNRLLARGARFRLPAELIRDEALAASGLLSEKIGGPSVFPPQPPGIWHSPYSGDKWVTSKGEDRYRRGIYTFLRRSAPYPEFMAFDKTTHEAICTRRSRTDTPLQALTTLNDPAFVEPAAELARKIVQEGGDSTQSRISFAFRRVLTRSPDNSEIKRLDALYQLMLKKYQADPKAAEELADSDLPKPAKDLDRAQLAAWTTVANVLFNLDETLTRE